MIALEDLLSHSLVLSAFNRGHLVVAQVVSIPYV